MATSHDHSGTSAPMPGGLHDDGGPIERTGLDCPWHPLPEEAVVQLVAIERRAVHTHRSGPPIQPARVVWGLLIHRDATTHERYDLPLDVYRALARDGGGRIQPMSKITAIRLNAAVERVVGGPGAHDTHGRGPMAPEQ